jgi:cysteine desulfurase/selenocysteine lyase
MNQALQDIRGDFPILAESNLIYFDNAATTQKPRQVLDAVADYYNTQNANPLRGLYGLSIAATEAYEGARETVRDFIGAGKTSEIVFTRNATEALNLVAYSYGRSRAKAGDNIVIAVSEHHSNILPWQMVARETGAVLRYLECTPEGEYAEADIDSLIDERTVIVATAQVSNVLGVSLPVERIIAKAHSVGAVAVIDGAQSAPHTPVDVTALDADFFVFSGHKLLAPMGIGVLYGKEALLDAMPPFLSGGEMIEYVTRKDATYAELPHKFEAGTVNAGGAVGLSAAIRYLEEIGLDNVAEHEAALAARMMDALGAIPHVSILGSANPADHHGIVSFNIEGCHPHDVASILDTEGVCIRAGHHCAQPLLAHLGIGATCRASVYLYNNEDEVDRFAVSLESVRKELGYGS